MVPCINREWHPFTIASANQDSHLSVYIKALGDWTNALHAAFHRRLDEGVDPTPLRVRVRVRGPYGAPCQHVRGYQRLVLIAGGIGATPFSSVCRQFWHKGGGPAFSAKNADAEGTNAGVDAADGVEGIQKEEAKRIEVAKVRLDKLVQSRFGVDIGIVGNENRRQPHSSQNTCVTQANELAELVRHDGANDVITNANALTSINVEDVDSTFESSGTCTSPVPHSTPPVTPLLQTPLRRRLRALANVLGLLHSARVVFGMCVLCAVRISATIAGSIFNNAYVTVSDAPFDPPASRAAAWPLFVRAGLGIALGGVLPVTVVAEIYALRGAMLGSWRRVAEIIAFAPALIATIVMDIVWGTGRTRGNSLEAFLQFVLFDAVLLSLLLGRLSLAVEQRSALIDCVGWGPLGGGGYEGGEEGAGLRNWGKRGGVGVLQKVDFIWTAAGADGDAWLRHQLECLDDGSGSSRLRVRRYLTREKAGGPGDQEEG